VRRRPEVICRRQPKQLSLHDELGERRPLAAVTVQQLGLLRSLLGIQVKGEGAGQLSAKKATSRQAPIPLMVRSHFHDLRNAPLLGLYQTASGMNNESRGVVVWVPAFIRMRENQRGFETQNVVRDSSRGIDQV
jgi:hypothetical protein